MAHLPLEHLNDQIEAAKLLVGVGHVYAHYKEPTRSYTVTELIIIEATDEVGVVYRANYDERISFVRPLKEWLAQVEHNGKMVPRFTLVQL